MAKNFPKVIKFMHLKIQKAQWTQNRKNSETQLGQH